MNGGCEAGIGFIGPHGDTFEFFELAEEVFDEMSPFIDFEIDGDRLGSTRMLGDDDLGTALVEFGDDGLAVEGLVRDQRHSRRGAIVAAADRDARGDALDRDQEQDRASDSGRRCRRP